LDALIDLTESQEAGRIDEHIEEIWDEYNNEYDDYIYVSDYEGFNEVLQENSDGWVGHVNNILDVEIDMDS